MTLRQFTELKTEVRDALTNALSTEQDDRVIQLTKLLEKIMRDEEIALGLESRAAEYKKAIGTWSTNAAPTEIPGFPQEGNKARGNRIRREFALSHGLSPHKGRTWLTRDGRRVGIATAQEDVPRGNLWWLGLPDQDFDCAVLICSQDDRRIEFVIDAGDLKSVWPKLSRSKDKTTGKVEVKFHVIREATGKYFLRVPPAERVDLTLMLGNFGAFGK